MKKLTVFALLLILSGTTYHSAHAKKKTYAITRISIEAELLPDGNLKIEEARTYKFRGRYSWADYRLPLQKAGVVKDFTLRDEKGLYQNATSETAGTYEIRSDNDELYVKWFYKAKSETRTFILNYTITDVATVYTDIAELSFKFIGEANLKTVGNMDVTIRLPQPAAVAQVKAWAHGPLWGEIQFEAGSLKMTVAPLPKKTFWEARILMPAPWLPTASKRSLLTRLNSIVTEEADLARKANAAREQALIEIKEQEELEEKVWPMAIAIVAFGIMAWGFLFAKFGRGFKVPYANKIDSTIPDMPPLQARISYF